MTGLWKFDNGTDWKHDNTTFRTAPRGRTCVRVTHTYRLYYAGVDRDRAAVKSGDYILTAAKNYNCDPAGDGDVFVNGTPLTSFVGQDRHQLTITGCSKQARTRSRWLQPDGERHRRKRHQLPHRRPAEYAYPSRSTSSRRCWSSRRSTVAQDKSSGHGGSRTSRRRPRSSAC